MGEQCPVCESRSDLQDLAAGPLARNELPHGGPVSSLMLLGWMGLRCR
jgi:hypothetical protein